MRIPSGDLAPARRGRRRGGYGRHRHRLSRPVAVGVVAVLLVGVGVWVLSGSGARKATPPASPPSASPCPQPSPASAAPLPTTAGGLPAPSAISVRVSNGTPRNGLGHTVGNGLVARGFVVTVAGNAPPPVGGSTVVSYRPGGKGAADVVLAHLLGATEAASPAVPAGTVDVVLGDTFVRLRTPTEAALYLASLPAAVPPSSVPHPTSASRAAVTGCPAGSR